MNKSIQEHPLSKSILLHLAPGAAGTLVYVLITPALIRLGYPAILGILLAAFGVILPILAGVLLAAGKKRNGTLSLQGVVLFREPLPRWQLAVIPLGLIVWGFLATGITPLLDTRIAAAWFSWLPDWYFIFDFDQLKASPRSALMLTFVVGLFVNGITLPLVEEVYFRGYLLPRLGRFGKWAPLLNLSLFSLYHFWAPWEIFSRIIWMLPWVYSVWRKRNIYLGILAHCGANTIGWLLIWGQILGT
jgi:membrane protease YdiL (CAAX protease family)